MQRCTRSLLYPRAVLHVRGVTRQAPPLLVPLAREVLSGPTDMTDLWILALTAGLFGAAAWFVRLCERM